MQDDTPWPVLLRKSQTVRGKPAQMPRRLAGSTVPTRFQAPPFRKTHKNGIQGAGLQSGVAADVVSVFPARRGVEKCVQNLQGLWGEAQFHGLESSYVELTHQPR
jgi:hypothetical protein